jgi:hypothetical protein
VASCSLNWEFCTSNADCCSHNCVSTTCQPAP